MPPRSRSPSRRRQRRSRSRREQREQEDRRRTKWDDRTQLVEERPRNYEPAMPPPLAGPAPAGFKVMKILLSQRTLLIGKRGVNINEIRGATMSDITIEKNEAAHEAIVYVRGGNVELAEKMIRDVLSANRPPGEGEWHWRVVDVPPELVGLIVGPGGKKLRDMGERSGCKLKMILATEYDPNAPPGKQVGSIKGPPERIHEGEMALREQIDRAYQHHLSKSGPPLASMDFIGSLTPGGHDLSCGAGIPSGGWAPSFVGPGEVYGGGLGGCIIGGGRLEAITGGRFKGLGTLNVEVMAKLLGTFGQPGGGLGRGMG